jgi:DNA topoisomerase-1
VTDKLVEHFSEIVDVNFTARMEEELDEIAEGAAARTGVLAEFWTPFSEDLVRAEEKFERYIEEVDEDCPRCIEEGRVPPGRLQIRLGRYGRFIGCSRFAEEDGGCKYIRNLNGEVRPEPEMLDEKCPECGKQLVRKVGRYGPFVGCSGYPDCRYIKKDPPKSLGISCPQCGKGEIVEKRTRFGLFYGCDRYPECDFAVSNPPLKDHPCPECGSLLLERPKSYRCWNCGAELDPSFTVKKQGDPEAEAAARAAKSAARAERARAKGGKSNGKSGAKSGAKRSTAKRTTAKRSAAKRTTSRRAGPATGDDDAPAAAEG